MEDLTLIGLNHRTADITVREQFALDHARIPETWPVPLEGPVREAFILSTCNRVEVLAVGPTPETRAAILTAWA